MKQVYLLSHVHELPDSDRDDEKIIGVYATRESAEFAIARAKVLPGFRDYPDDFVIDEYNLNEDQWVEGFFTWIPSNEAKGDD